MKVCPFCAEEIQDAAIVCRFCNRELTPARTAPLARSSVRWWHLVLAGVFGLYLFVTLMPSASFGGGSSTTTSPVLALRSATETTSAGGGYRVIEGEVVNISSSSIRFVMAVVSWYSSSGTFITSDRAVVDYTPLMPGQKSPFKVMTRINPEMATYSIEFTSGGTTLNTRDER
jgi:hypothetical protein